MTYSVTFFNQFVFVYLDVILIFSPTLESHVVDVRAVLQWLLENRLFVKAEKCLFHTKTVSFLGFCLGPGQIVADPEKIRVVVDRRPSFPPLQVVAAISWGIDHLIQEALETEPGPGGGPPNHIFVPQAVRPKVLQCAHSSRWSGHPGVSRTLSLLRRRFWWPSIEEDFQGFVFVFLFFMHGLRQEKSFPLSSGWTPASITGLSRPCSHVALDFITGLPPSDGNGNPDNH